MRRPLGHCGMAVLLDTPDGNAKGPFCRTADPGSHAALAASGNPGRQKITGAFFVRIWITIFHIGMDNIKVLPVKYKVRLIIL